MKLGHVAVLGFLALPLIGFLLPKHSHASQNLQVAVVNQPTVQVGNTPNVNVSNTPNVTVANQVGIASLPPVQISSGSVNATVVSPVSVFSYADLYPIAASGKCTYVGGTQCTQDNFYAVPNGFNAVITDFNGFCSNNQGATSTAQLVAQWAGMTQNYTASITAVNAAVYANGGSFILTVAFDWNVTGAKFYAAAGTSVTASVISSSGNPGDACTYSISGYLVPTSATSPTLGVRGTPRRN
jgi:hypothetical protein